MENLLKEIRACTICADKLPLGPRPVLRASAKSKIIIVGQAPGTKVHASGIPWDDRSGKSLREWLGVTDAEFYNSEFFGIIPMGFCYPGRGNGGDLPPMPICAKTWHQKLIQEIQGKPLFLLIGQYAQRYYLGKTKKRNLTETVANYQEYLPNYFPLPHPSPRNLMWQRRNPWFENDLLPVLKETVLERMLTA